jgi:hypothetical protein
MTKLTLLTGATAAAAPTLATDGKALRREGNPGTGLDEGFDVSSLEDVICEVWSTAGTGVLTAVVRLWGYSFEAQQWLPVGITPAGGTDTNRGLLNNGVTIGEFASPADKLLFAQPIGALKGFARVAAEIVGALGGAGTAISVQLKAI